MMGDFNADCGYMTVAKWETVTLRHDPRFTWIVPDAMDTTVAGDSCAYDR